MRRMLSVVGMEVEQLKIVVTARVALAASLSFLLTILCAAPASARVLFVSPTGNDAQNGSNWGKAVRSPARAIVLASGEARVDIWCVGGVYEIQRPLVLPHGVRLYGGFSGQERSLSQRRIDKYPTVLKSAYGQGILVLMGGGPETRVDGFVLQGVRGRECAIRLVGAAPTLTNNFFRWNQAIGSNGGAISCADGSNPLIVTNRFESNAAKRPGTQGGLGGAIFASESSPVIERNQFLLNSAEGPGGALCAIGGSPVLRSNLFRGNTATGGGAVFLSRAGTEIESNHFLQNVAGTVGGGIYLSGGADEHRIHNNLFANNVAVGAGAVALESCTVLFVNNTVTLNRSGNGVGKAGGAISGWGASSFRLFNNIVAFNTAGFGLISGNFSSGYNCVFGNQAYNYAPNFAPGNGDFSTDPAFVDRLRADFHLKETSPCRDRGDNGQRISYFDWEGDSRLFGSRIDIGADEVCARVVSLEFDRPSLCEGLTSEGTVTISMADPSRGIALRLTSSPPTLLKTPLTVIIPAGKTTAVFQAVAQEAVTPQDVTVTAVFGNSAAAGTIRVLPWLASHKTDPSKVVANDSTWGFLALNSRAPQGGLLVNLTSDTAAASVPASIIIPEGADSGVYPIQTSEVAADTSVHILAKRGIVSLAADLLVTPLIRPGTVLRVNNAQGEIGTSVTDEFDDLIHGTLQSEGGSPISGVSVKVRIQDDPKLYTIPVEGGEFLMSYAFPGPAGARRIQVEFSGSKTHLASSGEATLTSLVASTYTDGSGEGVEAEPGSPITLYIWLTNADGVPQPNQPLDFHVLFLAGEAEVSRYVGTAVTDGNGLAALPYIVQENDFGYLGRFHGMAGWLAATTEETENPEFILVLPGRTELSVGAIDGQVGQVITILATLRRRSDGAPLPNREITVSLPEGGHPSGMTDGNGVASISYKLTGPPVSANGTASFDGDDFYEGTQTEFPVTVRKADVVIEVRDVRGKQGTRVVLRATLTRTSDSQPMSGRELEFFVRFNDGSWESVGTDRTDANGNANINNVFLHPQWAGTSRKIRVKFAGGDNANPGQGEGTLRTDR